MIEINTEHHEYKARNALWKQYRDLYTGGAQFKGQAANYLIQRNREPMGVYQERLNRAFYENYIGSIVDWYAATLFRREPVISIEGDNEKGRKFFSSFVEDCDRKGSNLSDFFRKQMLEALICGSSYTLVDFPRQQGKLRNRAEEEALGAANAYLVSYATDEIINWSTDERGEFDWVVIRTSQLRRQRLEDPEPLLETNWHYYDRQNFRSYRQLSKPGMFGTAQEVVPIELVDQGLHGLARLNRVPIFEIKLSDGMWLMNKAADVQLEHFNKSNALSWALTMGLFAMPVVYSDKEWNQIVGDSYYIQMGPDDKFGCSAGESGGIGNLNGSVPYTSCDYTRSSCEQRGMFQIDNANTPTRRFGGVEFVPSTVLVRGYGEKGSHLSGPIDNEAKYNDVVPLIYGTAWVQPPVTLARNDGNLTRMEVLLGAGEMQGVLKVIVNDIEIPLGSAGRDMTSTGWYNVVSLGNRTGDFNLDFRDNAGNPVGDPYGSMAVLSVVVPNRINDGRSLPRVQALVEGMKLPTFDTSEGFTGNVFTSNPAWVLLDVLRRSGWDPAELDIKSFAETALYCDDPITTLDLHGNTISIPRFQCNLALRRRRSAADVLRGVRNSAGLMLSFGNGGKLQCRFESTFGVQQAVKPAGSNATELLLEGWPAYEFGDGSTAAGGILRTESGAPRIRFYSRSSADAPNRFSVEFQDAFNEYQQDSLSLVDVDDVLASGQETSAALPALGLANFDQATRMVKLQLLKSVKGNLYVEFETSVRAFGLRPGDLITLTYEKEGFLRQAFRVLRMAPGLNHRTTVITAQIHDDDWYVQTAGNGAASSGRQPKYELGLPRPLGGSVIDEDGVPQFGITESYDDATDGSAQTRLTVEFTAPARPSASRAGIPLVGFSALAQGTGGTLKGDQVLYYALTGVDSDGAESGLSFIVHAVIPPGTNTNTVTLQGLSFGSQTQTFHVYRGTSPQQLHRIAADVALAGTWMDTGAAEGLIAPPDENYSHANFFWRWEQQGPMVANLATWNTVGNSTLTMLGNEYRGQVVRIVSGKGAGQERRIFGNTPTLITLEDKWAVIPDATSKFVVAEPSWTLGATSATSPVSFLVPNQEGYTIHVSGRSANANNKECPFELCPMTRWRIVGAAGMLLDLDVPPKPVFAMQVKGDGTVDLLSVGFPTFDNTRSIAAGTLTLRYWDELLSPSGLRLTASIDDTVDTISISDGVLTEGMHLQIGEEILRITSVGAGATTGMVTRGSHGSPATAHDVDEPVYPLRDRTEIVPFSRDFFGSPASGSYNYTVNLTHARVAAGDFFVTNQRGDSPVDQRHFTATAEYGLRTLKGGQLNLQVEGPLSIEDDATPPLVIEDFLAMKDIYAVVQEAPTEVPVVVRLRQDGDEVCTLTIPVNATISNVVDGFGLPALRGSSLLHLDIVSVGQTATSTPGADLTVTVRL